MKRLWFSQGQKVSCVYFCFLANSPIIMNSCRSKSDCRRGNMDLTMTFRTVTITTTTKRDEENDNADATRRRAKRFILENVQIRTRSTYYINDDDDVTCIISGGDYERTRPTDRQMPQSNERGSNNTRGRIAGTSRGGWRSNKIVKALPPPSPSRVTSSSNTCRGGGEYIIGIKKIAPRNDQH
ncbi:hypothetical protein AGLY_004446 [Aphis glycines]|uniref:Uncharacterized protein n=1 Tax=Aphis glycines TaxID=307491 RepID=A0A6G0TZ05_APHGL|nr:hypothetical protein AGLY_004446 [Aphis glycines]